MAHTCRLNNKLIPLFGYSKIVRSCNPSSIACIPSRTKQTVYLSNEHGCRHSSNFVMPNSDTPILEGQTTRIGCASGFWGDTSVAAPQLVQDGKIDFLVFDYLSEITMSLLTAAKAKKPDLGYAPDFVHFAMAPLLKEIKRQGIRVVSNGGGINPHSCAAALTKACQKAGVEMNIAVVTGDDLMDKMSAIKEEASGLDELPPDKRLNSMNAYLGAGPIAKALDLGADIVVTGRCVDSALALGPLMHTFKWEPDEYDLLAAGSLAGHLIECGAQVTGGIFTDWETVPAWHKIGFPIVECAADGKFVVTKPPNTGGLVNRATVAEQLVYEIADPENYFLPDITCDFSQVTLNGVSDINKCAVLVAGAKGKCPTNTVKVSGTYLDGYRTTAVACVVGPHAQQKAERVAKAILKRCRNMFSSLGFADFSKTNVEILGSENAYGPRAAVGSPFGGPREVVLWLAVQHEKKEALAIFSREVAPAGTGMAPGLTGLVGGRPGVSPVLRLCSFMYPKEKIKVDIHMNEKHVSSYEHTEPVSKGDLPKEQDNNTKTEEISPIKSKLMKGTCTFPLGALAYTRSGDKGNTANIGVICRNPGYYPFLKQALTAEAIERYFFHMFDNKEAECKVKRYELPGIYAFNFVLENSLGGGGIASLRSDPQGKGYGQMLLDFKVKNVPDLLPSTAERLSDSYGM